MYLPGSALTRDYEVPVPAAAGGSDEKIQVHYVGDHLVQIVFRGKTYQVPLQNPGDQIKITIPK